MSLTDALAHELKLIIRLADRRSEQLAGHVPAFSEFRQVADAGELTDDQRIYFVLYTLIPDLIGRMPTGPDGMAIRELLQWRDEQGQSQSLTTRYHKASRHLRVHGDHFEKRQEPRLLGVCAQWFREFDMHDRVGEPRLVSAQATSIEPQDPSDQSEICFAIEQTTRELARCDNAALRMQLFDAVLRGGDAPQRLTAAQHAVASEAVRRARARDVAAAWPALADALDDASPSTSKPSLAVPPRPPRAMR